MNISPTEAEEALAAIQIITQKTRHSIASGGTYITLIVTGLVWLIGFVCTQFLPENIIGYIWGGLSIIGTILATILGFRQGRRVHSPSAAPIANVISSLGAPDSLLHRDDRGRWPWMGSNHQHHYPVRDDWLSLAKPAVLVYLRLVAAADYRSGVGLLFLLPGYFYLWTGILCGGGMICPWPVHPLQVVNHAELNETIHQPVRLRIMAALIALEPTDEVDFTYLRDLLEVTNGNLGAHLRKLEEAGYIAVNKTFVDRKPHTYVSATASGARSFRNTWRHWNRF